MSARLITSKLHQYVGYVSTRGLASNKKVQHHKLACEYFDQFPTYARMVASAKEVARRSIIVKHSGLGVSDIVGGLRNIDQVYMIQREHPAHVETLCLIEFQTPEAVENVIKQSQHEDGKLSIPMSILRHSGRSEEPEVDNFDFPVHRVRLDHLKEPSINIYSYSSLMSKNMMSLVCLKMRFITLINIERILCSGPFCDYELMPFGSSVTDIGCDSTDLDIVVTLRGNHERNLQNIKSRISSNDSSPESHIQSTFLHLDKPLDFERRDRDATRSLMRWFDYNLREFMPIIEEDGVISIWSARVPIIKFTASITSIDCDLSFNFNSSCQNLLETNYSGVFMSEILYEMYRNNDIFRALVIYMRVYAKLTKITADDASSGLTNFQLLSLVIFYLQATKSSLGTIGKSRRVVSDPILPKLDDLMSGRCTMSVLIGDKELEIFLPQIIRGFLHFYSEFDFRSKAIDMNRSTTTKKPDNASIYIINPLDTRLNVCKSVSAKSASHLISQIKKSLKSLHNDHENDPLSLIRSLMRENQQSVKNVQNKFRRGQAAALNSRNLGEACKIMT